MKACMNKSLSKWNGVFLRISCNILKNIKRIFLPTLSCEDKKAEKGVIWVSREKRVSALELQSNQNATDFTGGDINPSQEESSGTLQGLRPGYSTTLCTTCWAQELGSKCAAKSHGEGCGWENWLAYVVLRHIATELSLHGSHCAAPPPASAKKMCMCVRG